MRCLSCKKELTKDEKEDAEATGEPFCNNCYFCKEEHELLDSWYQ